MSRQPRFGVLAQVMLDGQVLNAQPFVVPGQQVTAGIIPSVHRDLSSRLCRHRNQYRVRRIRASGAPCCSEKSWNSASPSALLPALMVRYSPELKYSGHRCGVETRYYVIAYTLHQREPDLSAFCPQSERFDQQNSSGHRCRVAHLERWQTTFNFNATYQASGQRCSCHPAIFSRIWQFLRFVPLKVAWLAFRNR